MELWKRWSAFTPILSTILVVACVVLSLGNYTAPTYAYDMTVKTASDATKMTSSDIPSDTKSNSDASREKKEVETETEEETTLEIQAGSFDLEDGVYNGTATGFGGPITVAVTIKDRTIVSIEIISAEKEDAVFFKRAQGVIAKILAAQDWNVDVVSGATYSSNGIIHAVENALTGSDTGNEPAAGAASAQEGASNTIAAVEETGEYKDGTYIGTGTGFSGALSVQVVISGGKIVSITVLQSSDGSDFLSRASSGVISAILSSQSTNVDTVSGATYSSVGIIQAVRSALAQAGGNPSQDGGNDSISNDTGNSSGSSTPGVTGTIPYPDGTYYGVGEGYLGDIKLAMVISNHTITSITVVESSDDQAFFGRAVVLLDRAIAQQSTNLDTVSGATYSSRGLIEAMNHCLASAKNAAGLDSSEDESSLIESYESTDTSGDSNANGTSTYTDGVYSATVTCTPDEDEDFEPYQLSVQITVQNNRIVAVNVTGNGDSSNDTYIRRAADGTSKSAGVVTQIVQKGNVSNIDTVSRATCSSNSIIAACSQALAKAAQGGSSIPETISPTEAIEPSGEVPETEESVNPTQPSTEPETTTNPIPTSPTQPTESTASPTQPATQPESTVESMQPTTEAIAEPTQPTTQPESTSSRWKDGTYTTSVLCVPDEDEDFEPYQLSLALTIQNDRIVSISDVNGSGSSDNASYIRRAANGTSKKVGVVTQIIEKQSLEVDAVSGATCSSKAIIEACEKALGMAQN